MGAMGKHWRGAMSAKQKAPRWKEATDTKTRLGLRTQVGAMDVVNK